MGTTLTIQNSIQEEISQGMLAIIRCRIFCFLVCYSKFKDYKVYRSIILPVFMGVKLGRSH